PAARHLQLRAHGSDGDRSGPVRIGHLVAQPRARTQRALRPVVDGPTERPMFPLGSVLFPTLYLPLHVFEERYRLMVHHCLDGDRRFGVVLIERGHEVGGGDVRTMVGTMAQILEAAETPDGRWAVGAVGTHRVRVHRWLDDSPYPRADVEEWPDD